MNLLNIILNEEPIGGLEIADDCLRFSRLNKDKSGLKVELLLEEKLDTKNTEASLAAKLIKFAKQNNLKYVIVSLPADNIFTKVYSFPLAMTPEKITESLKLTVELQLPKKPEEIYCDWMELETADDKKFLLSFANKTYLDNLISQLKKANLKIVAIESHALSVARVIKQNKDEVILVAEKGLNKTSFSLIKNNNLFYSKSVLNNRLEKGLASEINKIVNYYDWFGVSIKNIILLSEFTGAEIKKIPLKIIDIELIDELKQIQDSKWLIPLGAALRGIVPRKDDKMLSLMELGTETAYHQEKAKATVNFFMSISIVLSIFFIGIFFATWSLISVMQNNYIKQISAFNTSQTPDGSLTLREKATNFNNLIEQTSSLIKKEATWSKVISEIKNKTSDGIIINNLSVANLGTPLSVTGVATSREAINNLKQSFETSQLFTDVNIPLNNLGQKVDIPFSMTFKIK